MSYSKKQLVADAKFVVSECNRLQLLLNSTGLREIEFNDHMSSLPHPNGFGEMICGRAAAIIITKLAKEAAERGSISKKVSLSNIRKETAKIFVQRFFKEAREIDTKQIDRLLSTVIKTSNIYRATKTHLIPCHLMLAKDPDKFTLGPVTFHNRSGVNRLITQNKKIQKDDSHQSKHKRYLLAKALRYYRKFRWIAEVTIPDCDAEISAKIAQDAVTSSLNCLHLLLGIRNSSRMQIGGLDISSDRRAKLTIGDDGELEPSISFSYLGEVIYSDGWSEILSAPHILYFKNLYDVALEVTIDPDLDRPVSRRFIDAAQWFGEAVRDSSAATRTVKFVTSLERMLMTDERDDIASLVSERVAALCFNPEVSREDWRKNAKSAYDLRSRLVHGSISPSSAILEEGAVNAAEIIEMTLRRCIEAFGADGLREGKVSNKRLARWFDAFIKWADLEEEAMLAHIASNGIAATQGISVTEPPDARQP